MDYNEVIKSGDYGKIRALFESNKPVFGTDMLNLKQRSSAASLDYQQQCIYQYKVDYHDVFDSTIRAKKRINKDTGKKDGDGNSITQAIEVEVARVGLPFQELIVERRVGFMLSDPVKVEAIYSDQNDAEKNLVALIERIQNDNKMDYKNKEIARRMMSELQCAEIWYFVENKEKGILNAVKKMIGIRGKFTLKMKIVSPDLGDTLYPLFDSTGDLISFARAYKLKEDGKDIEHFDIYDAEAERKFINDKGTWVLDPLIKPNPIPNVVQKIMVIYHTQPLAEWSKVESMIDRFENIVSNHADMNDYFGSPILAVSGEVQGFVQKGEQGKILQLDQQAQAHYLALSSEPQSIKMEKDDLSKYIYTMSQTPDITFEQMKGLGAISGTALKLLFLDAHMAVKNKEEIFGMGLQRRLNLIKAAIGAVVDTSLSQVSKTVQVKPIITPYLPENTTEIISNLTLAVTGGIMSKETAIEQNPLIPDKENELSRMQDDATAQLAAQPVFPQNSPTNNLEK